MRFRRRVPQLTPIECRALRLATIFGRPPESHPDLDSALLKLHQIEAAAVRRGRKT